MFKLPAPKTALTKLALNVILVGVIAALGYYLKQPEVVQGGMAYVILKAVYDILNSNTPTV